MLWQFYCICVGQGGCNFLIKENIFNVLSFDLVVRKMGLSSFFYLCCSQKILGKSLFINFFGD